MIKNMNANGTLILRNVSFSKLLLFISSDFSFFLGRFFFLKEFFALLLFHLPAFLTTEKIHSIVFSFFVQVSENIQDKMVTESM